MNFRHMTERKANASAKTKEVEPNASDDIQLHHICSTFAFGPIQRETSKFNSL